MIEPYYRDEWTTLYCGDARDVLPQLFAADILPPLVALTDPPYAIGVDYDGYEDTGEHLDELVQQVVPLLCECASVTAITCGTGNLWRYPPPTWTLAWVNAAGAGLGPWGFCCWSPIIVYGADPYKAAGLGSRPDTCFLRGVRTNSTNQGAKGAARFAPEQSSHPVAKPVDVWRWLLQRVSLSMSDVVLDPFVGGGTTLRVARDLGRRSIGVEQSEVYCELAVRSLAQQVIPVNSQIALPVELELA